MHCGRQYTLEFQFFRAPVAQVDIDISSPITSSGSQSRTESSSLTTSVHSHCPFRCPCIDTSAAPAARPTGPPDRVYLLQHHPLHPARHLLAHHRRQSTITALSGVHALTGFRSGIPSHHGSAGAISGGVIGGVVVVLLVVLGSWYFFCRSRRREATAQPWRDNEGSVGAATSVTGKAPSAPTVLTYSSYTSGFALRGSETAYRLA